MALATTNQYGSGTTFAYEDPDNANTYIDLPNALNIGEISEVAPSIDVTPISSETKEYISDLADTTEVELIFNDYSHTGYNAFLALARQKATVNVRTTFKNGRILTRSLALLGAKFPEPAAGSQLKAHVMARQSGAAAESFTA